MCFKIAFSNSASLSTTPGWPRRDRSAGEAAGRVLHQGQGPPPRQGGAGAVQRGGAERRVLPRQEERKVHRQERRQGDQVRGRV